MFERRLKVFLFILIGVMSLLLLRAVHLQVFTRGTWVRAAEEFKKRPVYLETTRGRILDAKGHEIAVDEACMDACVDYRAISRDQKWVRDIATQRAVDAAGESWKAYERKQRTALIDVEVDNVLADIDRMFQILARESGRPAEEIEEAIHQIDLRVAMRSRMRQYRRFVEADQERLARGDLPWYRKWLIEGGKDGPDVDKFEDVEGEEVGIHPVVKNISQETYLRLAREQPRCPGLVLKPGTFRKYPYGHAASHLIGLIAPVKKEDMLADPNLGTDPLRMYQFTDLIGRAGLESLLEPSLRGTRGKSYRRLGSREEELDTPPAPGRDVRTTIDIDLQDQIRNLFEHMVVPSNLPDDKRTVTVAMHGAAVVIDVKSGAVRALASYPDYDVNELSDQYEEFVGDPKYKHASPLMNHATQSQIVPGSTIKPLVGLAAITQGLNVPTVGHVTAHTGIECTGYLMINGRRMPNGRCWVASKFEKDLGVAGVSHHPVPIPHVGTHGNRAGFLTFADALERSCNVYFETIADSFGVEGLSHWYERFGLGRETGVGVSEAIGRLPRDFPERQPSVAWFSAIGQVGVEATPIQMANVAATIARDGVWVRPRLVEEPIALNPVRPRGGRTIPDRVDLKLSREAIAAAKEGMVKVVNSNAGTGTHGRMAEFTVAGKTGTAQAHPLREEARDPHGNPVLDDKGRRVKFELPLASTGHETSTPWYRGWGPEGKERNHAWFIGYAPAEDPQVAFAVLVHYGGSGGQLAATTATKILVACVEHGYIKPKK